MTNYKIIKRIYLIFLVLVAAMTAAGVYLSSCSGIEVLRAEYIRDVAIDAIGMLMGCVLMLGLYREDIDDKRNHAMFRMIFTLSVLLCMDAVSSYIEGNPDHILAIKIVNVLHFIFEDVLAYVYWTYVREELNIKGKFMQIANRICLVVVSINIILDVINIWFGMLFDVSETGEYIDLPFEFMGDIAIFIVFILAAVAILYVAKISINEKLILMSFEVFPFVAYIAGDVTRKYMWILPAYLISVLLIYTRIFAERGKKLAKQEVELTKQSTALMVSQIQPHFLYNVLTTISNLCVTDPEEAEETTVLFSQYLRTNLDSLRNQNPVPFATELMHIKTYVELEKKRFGDILNVEYDINEQNFSVPSLGLQPIVENSIKHGLRGKNAPGHIKIGTYKAPKGYRIVIEDDGVGFDMNAPVKADGRSHVGMTNVKERLRQMCNATMTIDSSPGCGCRTEIFIPEES